MRKLRGPQGLSSITAAFRRLPRKSWKGQRLAAARVLHLELVHKALSHTCFKRVWGSQKLRRRKQLSDLHKPGTMLLSHDICLMIKNTSASRA